MTVSPIHILEKLDQADQEKVSYFIRLLLHQEHYRTLREELALRRDEIQQGDTLTHDEIWDSVNV